MSSLTTKDSDRSAELLHRNFPGTPTLRRGNPCVIEHCASKRIEVTLGFEGSRVVLSESRANSPESVPEYRLRVFQGELITPEERSTPATPYRTWKSKLAVTQPCLVEVVRLVEGEAEKHAYFCKIVP